MSGVVTCGVLVCELLLLASNEEVLDEIGAVDVESNIDTAN